MVKWTRCVLHLPHWGPILAHFLSFCGHDPKFSHGCRLECGLTVPALFHLKTRTQNRFQMYVEKLRRWNSVQQDRPAILIEILLNREMRTKQGGVHQMVPIHTHYLLWFLRSLHLLQLTMWRSDKIPTAPESLCRLATKHQVDKMQPKPFLFFSVGSSVSPFERCCPVI